MAPLRYLHAPFPFSRFSIPRERVQTRAVRSSGPGGQNVNKTSTKVEIRFLLAAADWIPEMVRQRLKLNYSSRVNGEDEFILTSEVSRSQSGNLEDCYSKLLEMIRLCWSPPKRRVPTKPSRSSREKRLQSKQHVSEKKKNRSVR